MSPERTHTTARTFPASGRGILCFSVSSATDLGDMLLKQLRLGDVGVNTAALPATNCSGL